MGKWLGKAVWGARLAALAILAISIVASIASQAEGDSRRRDHLALANLRNDYMVTHDGILIFKCNTQVSNARENLRAAGKRALQQDVRCVLLCLGEGCSTGSWEDVLTLDIWLRSALLLGTSGRHFLYFEEGTNAYAALPCLYMYKSGSTLRLPETEKWPSAINAFKAELLLVLREAEISGNTPSIDRARELIERSNDDHAVVEFLAQRYDLSGAMKSGSLGADSRVNTVHLDSASTSHRFAPWPVGARQDSAAQALEQLRKDLPQRNSAGLTARCATSVVVSVLIFLIALLALFAPDRLPTIALSDQSMHMIFALGTAFMLGPTIALAAPLARDSCLEPVLRPFVVGFGSWWYYPVLFAARLLVGVGSVGWILPTLYPDQSDPRLRRNLTLFVCIVASLGPAISVAAEARLYIPSLFDPAIGNSSGLNLLLFQLIFCLAVTVLLVCAYMVVPKSPRKACGGRSSQFKFAALLVVTALTPVLAAPLTLSSSAMRSWRKLRAMSGRSKNADAATPRVLPEVLLPLASSTSAARGFEYVGLLLAAGMAALFANSLLAPFPGGALVPALSTVILALIVPMGALAALAASPRQFRVVLGLIIAGSVILPALPWGPVPIWHAVARFFGNAAPNGFDLRAFTAGAIAGAALLAGTYGMYRFTTDGEVVRALMLETRLPNETERRAWRRLRQAPLVIGMLMPACLACVSFTVQLSTGMDRSNNADFLLALLLCASIGWVGGWAMRLDKAEPISKWYDLFEGLPRGAELRYQIASALPGLAKRFPQWLEGLKPNEPDRFE